MTKKLYCVQWHGFTNYIIASTGAKARAYVMSLSRSAGYWEPGRTLTGLRCYVAALPPGCTSYEVH